MLNLSTFCVYWLNWIVAASWQLSLLVCVVALISIVARKASARFRHGLWLLVLLKMFLPTGLATPLSIGDWCIGPIVHSIGKVQIISARQTSEGPTFNQPVEGKEDIREERTQAAFESPEPLIPIAGNSLAANLFLVWCTGCLLFWSSVLGRFVQLRRLIRQAEVIDEGPLCIAVEKCAIALGLRRVPEIVIADLATNPFLIGVLRPAIVLPRSFLTEYTECQQQAVLIHELVHWLRFDTWIGCPPNHRPSNSRRKRPVRERQRSRAKMRFRKSSNWNPRTTRPTWIQTQKN
jgi:bla regulator protein BlaR1